MNLEVKVMKGYSILLRPPELEPRCRLMHPGCSNFNVSVIKVTWLVI